MKLKLAYLTFKDLFMYLARQSTMTLQVNVCKMLATALMWWAIGEVCYITATANTTCYFIKLKLATT